MEILLDACQNVIPYSSIDALRSVCSKCYRVSLFGTT